MSVPSLEFMHLVDEQSFVLLFLLFNGYVHDHSIIILSMTTHFSLSHSCLTSPHLFLMFLFNVLYSAPFLGIVCCLFFILLCIPSVIYYFFPVSLVMIVFADVTKFYFNVFHFELSVPSKLYLFLTWIGFFSRLSNCSLTIVLFFSLRIFILSLHTTGRWSL